MRTLIFHTMVAPHVQQDARALLELGWLHRYHTAFHDDPRSSWQGALRSAGRWVGFDAARELSKRKLTEVPADLVTTAPAAELLRIAAARLDRSGVLGDMVWNWSELAFDRDVARHRLTDAEAVFGYDHACQAAFEAAAVRGLRRIYNVPSPEPMFVHELLASEVEAFPELQTAHHRRALRLEGERTARRRREWNLADVVIVASRFTRDSFARRGRDVSRVRVVPLGAPPPCIAAANGPARAPDAKLSLLWAGTFGIRKGAHHLLTAWRAGNLGRHARLWVYGTMALPDRVLHPLPEGIKLMGSVPRAQLMEAYGHSDALVFPTLCDGFGMVATEAWSRGLPVITTDRAGCADLLRPGENGLLVRAGDPGHLREVLEECAARPERLRAMHSAALATAARWQWSDYRAELSRVLREAFLR